MNDFKEGVFDINGFILSKESKPSDFNSLPCEEVSVQISKRGNTYIKFLKPVWANGVAVFVEVSFYADAPYPEIDLFPSVPADISNDPVATANIKLQLQQNGCKEPLKNPLLPLADSVMYAYDWGYIRSAAREDPHYGLVGGEITVTYRGG